MPRISVLATVGYVVGIVSSLPARSTLLRGFGEIRRAWKLVIRVDRQKRVGVIVETLPGVGVDGAFVALGCEEPLCG